MKGKGRVLTALAGSCLILVVILSWRVFPAAAQWMSFDILDAPGGPDTYIMGINNTGHMAGYTAISQGSTRIYHGFIYDGVNFTLIDIPGATSTRVKGINDSGRFVGHYTTEAQHGFIHDGVSYQTLDVPNAQNTRINGINNQGTVVGSFDDAQGTHGFVYDGAVFKTLNFGYLGSKTHITGINNQGKMVGFTGNTTYIRSFMYDGAKVSYFEVGGEYFTYATGINDSGIIVGYFGSYSPGGFITDGSTPYLPLENWVLAAFPDLWGNALSSINNSGRLVGYYQSDKTGQPPGKYHGTVANIGPVNLTNYFIPKPLSRWCRYSYLNPPGFPGFTLRFTRLASGNYAGKYYNGDWNTPEDELAKWRILSWDEKSFYAYADSQIGDLPEPATFPTSYFLNFKLDDPLPYSGGLYWYFKTLPSLTVAAGTFEDVLIFIVLDHTYPPNAMNDALGLNRIEISKAVTSVTYYGRAIGELKMMDVDAQTGDIRFSYELQSTGDGGGGGIPLQLLLGE
jgi:probable HAF family extracellular repeat protein